MTAKLLCVCVLENSFYFPTRLTSLTSHLHSLLWLVKFPNDVRLEKNATKNSDVVRKIKRPVQILHFFFFFRFIFKNETYKAV